MISPNNPRPPPPDEMLCANLLSLLFSQDVLTLNWADVLCINFL